MWLLSHVSQPRQPDPTACAEANVLGNPPFPRAVRFLLPLFGQLFGSDGGELVRRLAHKHGWAIVWALGDANGDEATNRGGNGNGNGVHTSELSRGASPSSRANGRLLDPLTVGSAALNVSVPRAAADAFAPGENNCPSKPVDRPLPPTLPLHRWRQLAHCGMLVSVQ